MKIAENETCRILRRETAESVVTAVVAPLEVEDVAAIEHSMAAAEVVADLLTDLGLPRVGSVARETLTDATATTHEVGLIEAVTVVGDEAEAELDLHLLPHGRFHAAAASPPAEVMVPLAVQEKDLDLDRPVDILVNSAETVAVGIDSGVHEGRAPPRRTAVRRLLQNALDTHLQAREAEAEAEADLTVGETARTLDPPRDVVRSPLVDVAAAPPLLIEATGPGAPGPTGGPHPLINEGEIPLAYHPLLLGANLLMIRKITHPPTPPRRSRTRKAMITRRMFCPKVQGEEVVDA